MQTPAELRDKRARGDRRINRKPALKYVIFGGRRIRARRHEDKNELFIADQYDPRLLIIIGILLILSLMDGFCTLYSLERGAREIYPLMAYLLSLGPVPFIFGKFALTSSGIICLLVLSNMYFRPLRIYIRTIFPALVVFFALIIAWQIFIN